MKRVIAAVGVMFLVFVVTKIVQMDQKDKIDNDNTVKHSRIDTYTEIIANQYKEKAHQKKGLQSKNSFKFLEGHVGLDPWGKPYKYFIQKNTKSDKDVSIVLWSTGEDFKTKLTAAEIKNETHSNKIGDDFIHKALIKVQ